MYVLRITLLLSYFGCILCSDCDSMYDCISCVSKLSWVPFVDVNCRWCPLTEKCHAAGAYFYNDCPFGDSVTTTARCYEPETGIYDPENAYTNTLMSAVAYSDHPQQCMDLLFPRGGFHVIKVIGKKCEFLPLPYKECVAIVAVSDDSKLIFVAYRGTTNLMQLVVQITENLAWPKTSFKSGGEVQQYFNDAFEHLYNCAQYTLKELLVAKPNYDVVITGHSLGGAMASLTAASLVYDKVIPANRLTLYTFGMPRVGDKRYALAFDRLVGNSWRVVHYQDIVPRLPSRVAPYYSGQPYHHKTEVFYPNDVMLPNSDYIICHANEDDDDCANQYNIHPIDGVGYHTNYFSIAVGDQCSNIGARRRRSVDGNEISAMSHFFSNETCKVVDISDIVSSSQSATQYGHQLMIPSLVFGLSYAYTRY